MTAQGRRFPVRVGKERSKRPNYSLSVDLLCAFQPLEEVSFPRFFVFQPDGIMPPIRVLADA